MKTYQKHKYHHGMNVDRFQNGEWPTPMEYWAVNGAHLNNCLTQVNLKGRVSLEEENQYVQIQKTFVTTANEFGNLAQNVRQDHEQGQMDYLQSQIVGRFRPKKVLQFQSERKLAKRGTQTPEGSVIEEYESDMLSEDSNSVSVVPTDNETIIGSNYNQPRMSLDPKDALPPPSKAGFQIDDVNLVCQGLISYLS